MRPPPSTRAFVTGKTGSGKTSLLWHRYLSKAPRVLAVDQTGEWVQRAGALGAVVTDGALETIHAMREAAHRRRWWIVAVLNDDDLREVAERLLPPGQLTTGPVAKLGGVTLYLDEVDRVVSVYGVSDLKDLWRRGRHAGLSVLAATQRIGNVSKEVTSQADVIAILALHDVSDVDYIRALTGPAIAYEALAWVNSAPYRVALYYPASSRLVKLDGTGGPLPGT